MLVIYPVRFEFCHTCIKASVGNASFFSLMGRLTGFFRCLWLSFYVLHIFMFNCYVIVFVYYAIVIIYTVNVLVIFLVIFFPITVDISSIFNRISAMSM